MIYRSDLTPHIISTGKNHPGHNPIMVPMETVEIPMYTTSHGQNTEYNRWVAWGRDAWWNPEPCWERTYCTSPVLMFKTHAPPRYSSEPFLDPVAVDLPNVPSGCTFEEGTLDLWTLSPAVGNAKNLTWRPTDGGSSNYVRHDCNDLWQVSRCYGDPNTIMLRFVCNEDSVYYYFTIPETSADNTFLALLRHAPLAPHHLPTSV